MKMKAVKPAQTWIRRAWIGAHPMATSRILWRVTGTKKKDNAKTPMIAVVLAMVLSLRFGVTSSPIMRRSTVAMKYAKDGITIKKIAT